MTVGGRHGALAMPKTKKNPKLKKPEGAHGIPHHKLPVGRVVSQPVKGEFLTLPLFGWVAKRQKTEIPLVMLALVLIRSDEDASPRGTLSVELPVLEDTELATLAALERYGWDGRVWPVDKGWPDGSLSDEHQLRELMEQATLRATMTFPPSEKGVAAQTVRVERAQGPFLMPPLPEPEGDGDPQKLQRLRQLCENPRIFFRPQGPAVGVDSTS